MFLYLGPGVGVGSIIAIVGIFIAIAFLIYSFIILPIRKAAKKKQQDASGGDSGGNVTMDDDMANLEE